MPRPLCQSCGVELDYGEVVHNRVWIQGYQGQDLWIRGHWVTCPEIAKGFRDPLMSELERVRDAWRDRALQCERTLERISAIVKEVDLKENPPA